MKLPHRPLVYLMILSGLVILLGGVAFLYLVSPRMAQSAPPTRADVFIRSVATEDGALGWHQLCPSLQAQLSLAELRAQSSEQKAADARQGITLTTQYLGAQTQTKGGEMRFYLITAQRPDGWQAQRIYIVRTQPGGCVEDVQNVDIPGEGAK